MRITSILLYKVHNIPYRFRGYVWIIETLLECLFQEQPHFLIVFLYNIVYTRYSSIYNIVKYWFHHLILWFVAINIVVYVHGIMCRKHRIERKPTLKDIVQFKRDLEREEQNMLLLRHPYITREQSFCHMNKFKEEKFANIQRQWQEEKNQRFNRSITIADRLNHLKVTEVWD